MKALLSRRLPAASKALKMVSSIQKSTPSNPEKTTTNNSPTYTSQDSSHPFEKEEEREALEDAAIMEDPTLLRGAFKFAVISSVILTLLMDFIIPIPMLLSH